MKNKKTIIAGIILSSDTNEKGLCYTSDLTKTKDTDDDEE